MRIRQNITLSHDHTDIKQHGALNPNNVSQPEHPVLQLQQQFGNQAVTAMIKRAKSDGAIAQRKSAGQHKHKELTLDDYLAIWYGPSSAELAATHKMAKKPVAHAASKTDKDKSEVSESEELDLLFNQIKAGGISIALYVRQGYEGANKDGRKKVSGRDEFKSQATQFALDHGTVGLVDGAAKVGVAMEILDSVPGQLTALMSKLDDLLKAHPRAEELRGQKVKVKALNIFTHGYENGVLAAVGSHEGAETKNDEAEWVSKSSTEGWAKELAPFIADQNPSIILYACRAGGDPQKKPFGAQNLSKKYDAEEKEIAMLEALPPTTDKKEAKRRRDLLAKDRAKLPFTERVRLVIEAEKRKAGVKNFHMKAYGHLDTGHTSSNNRLAEFSDGARVSFLHSIGLEYLKQTHQDAMPKAPFTDEQINEAANWMLNVMREVERTKTGAVAKDSEGHTKYKTGKTDPSAVYLREIAFIGLDRAVKDLTATTTPAETTYDDLLLSKPAKKRLYKGLLILRQQFSDRVKNNLVKSTAAKP